MPVVTNPPLQKRTRESLEKIMVAGLQVLASKGPEGFTVAAVAKRAGVGSTAIYRRFEDKDTFLVALLQRFDDEFMSGLRPAYRALARSDLDLAALVRGFVGELAATYRHHQKLLRVFATLAINDPRIADATNRSVAAVALEFEEALLAHRDQFHCADPEIAVAVCFQTAQDSFLRLVLYGRQAHDELDWDRLADELSAMMLAYLLAKPAT